MASKIRLGNIQLSYAPPGPVTTKFLTSTSLINGIMGPIGSGKTSACCWFIMLKAMMQRPSPIDGRRYSRWAVVRDTYENLKRTALLTWTTWFPKEAGEWANGPPALHTLVFDHPSGDGTKIHLEVMFVGVGEHSAEDITRGWELTGAYLNEADRMLEDIFKAVRKRLGRYPSKKHGGPSWYGMIADFNAPMNDNWTCRRFILKHLPNHAFFEQPPGVIEIGDGRYQENPEAENLENLPEGYYSNEIAEIQADPEVTDIEAEVGRMIMNRPGMPRFGKPVFGEYRDKVHFADYAIEPVPGLDLVVATDAGRTPAAIFMQRLVDDRYLAIDEIILESADAGDMGDAINRMLRDRYPDWIVNMRTVRSARRSRIRGWGDPAADNASESSNDSWLDLLTAATRFPHLPAPGENNMILRLAAVNGPLKRMVGGYPGLLISDRCEVLRQAFMGGYHYPKRHAPGGPKYGDKPVKNEFSHPMDAFQNGLLGAGEFARVRHLIAGSSKGGLRSRTARMDNKGIGDVA